MAQFMTTIPRRKIYEVLLDFEDVMIEFQILLFSKENFDKYSPQFNSDKKLVTLNNKYKEIKALLLLFLKNKKYSDNSEFLKDLEELLNKEDLTQIITNQKKFSIEFISLLQKIDQTYLPLTQVNSLEKAKEIFNVYDEFNHNIPKILEKRREFIQV